MACARRGAHIHVAEPGQGLDDSHPTWIEEISRTTPGQHGVRPHVLLISIDTLRADHLGAWGYHRPTSPFLDALASHGVRFDKAFSHSPKTAPSHASVFTGVYPSRHGAHFEYTTQPPVAYPIQRALVTLPEVLRSAGYRTAAWTGSGQVSRKAGFARGFDRFLENLGTVTPKKMEEVRAWFRSNRHKPCFLFLHTYQVHDPYLPPRPYNQVFTDREYRGWVIGDRDRLTATLEKTDFETLHTAFWKKTGQKPDPSLVGEADRQHLLDLYDGAIRYTDDVFRGFFEGLRDDGLLDNTLVIFFSDHGEEFLEHGGLLHEMLYYETLHVPLIFFWPAGLPSGIVVDQQVPLMDLTPTLLELAGLDPLEQSKAHSLMPMIADPNRAAPRPVFSEAPWVHRTHHRSFRDDGMMVYGRGFETVELFDTLEDPLETEDLAPTMPDRTAEMLQKMTAFLAASAPNPETTPTQAEDLTDEEIEALRALGYVD